jgi:uncharacterized protein YceH (UPF0502 family)
MNAPQLSAVEARVLGSLVEKSFLTPDQYPLSLNALVNACNQKTSREPVMELTAEAVTGAIGTLFEKGLAVEQQGSRVSKYIHSAEKLAGPTAKDLAVQCVLLLRGAQTAAEVRVRTERMCEWRDSAEVEAYLEGLVAHDPPLAARLSRGRYHHLSLGAPSGPQAPAPAPDRLAALEARVAALEELLKQRP